MALHSVGCAPLLLFNLMLFILIFTSSPALASPALDSSEVRVLKEIATKFGKTGWNSVDPCSGDGNWNVTGAGFERGIDCDCSFDNGSRCYIISLLLKGENLTGELPPEFGQLRHLQLLDLSRNLFNGSVPAEWANMTLFNLSLMGNRLSGPFPTVLTKITTLAYLSIESNRFSGTIPSEIGKLLNLEKLTLSANEFSGELPPAIASLTNLTDLRICSNNFSGKIPDFIAKLKQLQKLHIQGCLLEGPIPPSFSALTKMADLRISDLKIGNELDFPDLSKMSFLKTMMLRNCSIHGNIPSYIGDMGSLKYLDLSFNKLTGEIPVSFENLKRTDYIYLTRNMLTGSIPGWILKRIKNVDISYNNFTLGSSSPSQCLQGGNVNAAESFSSTANDGSQAPSCLKRNFPCSTNKQYQYSLHINCGGKEVTVNGTKFEADTEERGASMLYLGPNWAFSSTGNFMDDDSTVDSYIVANTTRLSMPNTELYTQARISPLSLTYYGLCMLNGSYTVDIHFAEIIFTHDSTYNSLGKRLFNVFIQGEMVMENFNIADAAGGPGKLVVKRFSAFVTGHTLKIQFYWAGKGTTGIPSRGVYGPLVSAISVIPNFVPPLDDESPTSTSKKIAKIAIGVAGSLFIIIILFVGFCWRKRQQRQKSNNTDLELKGLDLQTGSFTLRQIKAATKNFDVANKIGEGGFGSVYKGLLSDDTIIAVKQLSSKSRQGNREFVTEIGMISGLQHPNLVKLYGCCTEGNQLLLIYEYMENNCLARALFGQDAQYRLKLDWPTRRKICLGIARGLRYLHEESRLRIVHRDIKASNVLLDKDLNAKISDFGLAKLSEDDDSHVTTRIAGTIGYMAPEYAMRGHLTDKADVYSFGVVALEIVSGKSNTNYRPTEEFVYLLDWACVLQERGTLLELIDPNLGSDYSKEEAMLMLQVALLCTNASPTLRPSMSKVVSLLQGLDSVQPLLPVLSRSANGSSSNGIRRHFWENVESESVSVDPTFTNSSESRLEDDGSVRPVQGSINSLSTGRSSPRGVMKNFRQHPFETQSMSMYRTCTESFESLAGDDEDVRPLQGCMSSDY